MRQTPLLLVLAALLLVPATAGAAMNVETDHQVADSGAEVSVQSEAEGDGWGTRTSLLGAFDLEPRDILLTSFLARLSAAAFVVPNDVLQSQDEAEPVVSPATETLQASPASEASANVLEDGASTQASGEANNEGVSWQIQATAAGRTVNEGGAAEVPTAERLEASIGQPDGLDQETAPDEPARPMAVAPQPLAASSAPSSEPRASPMVASGIVAVGVAGSTLAFVPGSRQLAWRWLRRLLGLALFSRIAQEDILTHARRAELFEFIKQNPGERIEGARRLLGLSNGSMHYHLKVLADRNLIRILRDGGIARMYPAGPKIQPTPYVPVQRKRVIELLSSRPGVTQREAAALLGISERMTSYHIQTLASQGLVEVRPEGARKRLFLHCGGSGPVAIG
jgi:DNA-binding MarR family transcriptional regulator